MGEGIRPPGAIDRLAFRLRDTPTVHGIGRFFRKRLWGSLVEGFWEFARHFFAKNPDFGPPLKTFSAYQALRYGWPKFNGRIVLHDQGVPKTSPESLLVQSGLEQHLEQPWPIFWSEHSNATLVSESLALLLPNKTLCIESAYDQKRWRLDPAGRFLRLPPPTQLSGNWTSIISKWVPNRGFPVYGHWLHDALPRLALLEEFPPNTGILVPPDLKPYHKETLQLLGVWDRCRPSPEAHLQVERYFFSSPVSMIDCYNPYAVHYTRKALLPKADPNYSGPRKFFLQRTSPKRSIENSAEIADFFRRKGWAVVRDVDLTFAQTIKLFSEAEALCSQQGSNMSNVIFCRPGCVVMHLVPDINLDGWIDWIAEVCNLNYHFSIIRCGSPIAARFSIPPRQIEEMFESAGVSF